MTSLRSTTRPRSWCACSTGWLRCTRISRTMPIRTSRKYVGTELYQPLLELARAANGLPADGALDGLGDALGHPLVAPHPGRVADLRLAMAAALAVEG